MRAAVVTILAALLCVLAAPVAGAHTGERRAPAECAALLDCTAEEINLLGMTERLELVRALSSGPAAALIPGYAPRWRNIEGIIDFFRDHDMGAPGTWVSYVDAGIIEGIERGIAIASGRGGGTFGNPGAPLWAEYLTDLRAGRLAARSAHDRAWSEAEQASTEYGVALAERVHGRSPTAVEQRFFAYSEFYRWTLRNRPALLDLVSPGARPGQQRQVTFVDWFTDVTNDVPSRRGAELALDLAEFDAAGGTLSMLALFHAYTWELWGYYLADTARE
ncbi:hypothetical protein B0I33_103316 [Prauserella shujinwangii]|uniref:Uncharacterized protein n=1 Tax=Prauserella shujinwangii TaxID=1453103 RepID=A0A2T0LYZ8_9PSEU|nr:hypothetical protein [Prauserella shujinwangii]PRX49282.1 hypothetical protein B0I33_103316 [Prauserella shujinwangii]